MDTTRPTRAEQHLAALVEQGAETVTIQRETAVVLLGILADLRSLATGDARGR